jgi:UDP-glucose 4-epimerase
MSGGSLVIFGDGNQTRDFIFLDDTVEALVLASTAGQVDRSVINIGSGSEVSINQLTVHIASASGRKVNLLYNRTQSGGVSRLVADVQRARQLLSWSPRIGLDEGLHQILERDPRFQPR